MVAPKKIITNDNMSDKFRIAESKMLFLSNVDFEKNSWYNIITLNEGS